MTDVHHCLFCKIAAKEIPAQLVHEDEICVAFRDISPKAPEHFLLIPRQHIATMNDLSDADRLTIGHLTYIASRLAIREGFAEAGYRVVMNCNADGGQSVFHLHLHILAGRQMTWPPG